MEKKQTAMMQLKKRLESGKEITIRAMQKYEENNNTRQHFYIRLGTALSAIQSHLLLIEPLLELEREQIQEGFNTAIGHKESKRGEQYYNEMYGDDIE